MSTIDTALYTAAELREKNLSAFYHAKIESQEIRGENEGKEMERSFRALLDSLTGVYVKEFIFFRFCKDFYLNIKFEKDEDAKLSGDRAFLWFEKNLFRNLRVLPVEESNANKYLYGFEDKLLDYIRKGISDGTSVGEILEGLVDECCRLLEVCEFENDDKRFIDFADANGLKFNEYGWREITK